MNRDEQTLIQNLFGKLSEAERSAPPREADADRFIQDSVARQPAAPYYMAQTIIVQEQALEAAHARIQELESQPARSQGSGGFFGSLFGSSQPARQAPAAQRPQAAYGQNAYGQGAGAAAASGPWNGGAQGAQGQPGAMGGGRMGGGGGGFLAGAAQTAMGVAGGVVLGSMLTGLMAGDDPAAAAEGAVADAGASAEEEVADLGGGEDFGGDDFDEA